MLRLRLLLPLALAYAKKGEPINGRTRLQKMVFLLQEGEADFPDKYAFRPHDYGPYAANLQMDLDDMIERGIIKEDPRATPDEKTAFLYTLTPAGREFIERVLADEALSRKHKLKPLMSRADDIKTEANRKPLLSLPRERRDAHPSSASGKKLDP